MEHTLTAIVAIAILVIGAHYGRKAMEKPVGITLQESEQKLGELYVETRDLKLGGFHWEGSGLEGKLVLTNRRLMYSKFDERRIAVSLEPADVTGIESGQKGLVMKADILKITYNDKKKNKARTATFKVLSSFTAGNKTYHNTSNAASFTGLLNSWKKGAS